ncbi:DUF2515 family protein [Fictibacillus aquaticus]|uniref:DUF2515 domain-containing protein n=1 Tax=Fictibacillus aquaticus TaxID=2021314 RepID=A0A235FB58_9BACL|nr:DUF2515 family protein [Fictibacillus aquaticus]OYD58566.1 hypothetical protein CGZ90_01290 [Fictibacillus aquaticus]
MSIDEQMIIEKITKRTEKGNKDNISRTVSYERFYREHPEIQWAFLAGMVSRNAGYSMTDLKGEWMERSLGKNERSMLFFTYERANWLIFEDAFPQLLLYEYSKRHGKDLMHLLPRFFVSSFMAVEWRRFMEQGDRRRLYISQIINEQNLIQRPVISHPVYRKRVFLSLPFKLQNWLHFSTVLFPKLDGTLFGFSVHGFRQLHNRIALGKKLAALLLESEHRCGFEQFSVSVPPTGSRRDYEQFVYPDKPCESPMLRTVYPFIWHHRGEKNDWSITAKVKHSWYKPLSVESLDMTQWYKQKQRQLKAGILLKEILLNK